ncbi:MAG: cache domain-containing protein, partial [Verrucomicrobiota bacterium]
MRFPIRQKIALLIVLPTVLILLMVFAIAGHKFQKRSTEDVERQMTELAWRYANQFDGHLREAAQLARSTAAAMEVYSNSTPENLFQLMEQTFKHNQLLFGVGLAFQPGAFQGKDRFGVFVYYDETGALKRSEIGSESYDYTEEKWEWWHAPQKAGTGVWTDPYFDSGTGTVLMSTYSVPFYNKEGEFQGVAFADLALEPLRQLVDSRIASDLNFTILTQSGKYVFHEDPTKILNDSIFDKAKQIGSEEAMQFCVELTSGKSGLLKFRDLETEEEQWI